MKSFLKEIESKFRELEEKKFDRDGDGDETDDYLAARDAAIKKAMKKEDVKNPGEYTIGRKKGYDRDGDGVPNGADSDPDDGSVFEAAVCEECGEVHEGHCNSKHEDVDEAHCNTKQEDIEEASLSGGVAAYSPANFLKNPKAPKKKYKWASVSEAMDKKYEKLIESYSKFATGNPKSTPSQTVNGTIKEVAKKLQEIEQLVKYTSRLKNESGIAGSTYGKSTHNALNKISERLLKISERVRSLGE